MEQLNTEKLELVETERAGALRGELAARIDELVAEGIFTISEGRAWIVGGEDCGDNAEWVQELLDYLNDFEAAGEEVAEELKDLLKSPLWHTAERAIWRGYIMNASYQEKRNLVGLFAVELRRRMEEAAKKQETEARSGKEVIQGVERAIRDGKLDEAGRWLDTLDLIHHQSEYKRLSEQLAEAMVRRTREALLNLEAA